MWRAGDPNQREWVLQGRGGPFKQAKVVESGCQVVTCSVDGVALWKHRQGELLKRWKHYGQPCCATMRLDSGHLLAGSDDGAMVEFFPPPEADEPPADAGDESL